MAKSFPRADKIVFRMRSFRNHAVIFLKPGWTAILFFITPAAGSPVGQQLFCSSHRQRLVSITGSFGLKEQAGSFIPWCHDFFCLQ